MRATRRRSLTFRDWPKADQDLWHSLIAKGDILDGNGPGADWASSTKDNTRKAYGYWLYWVAQTDGLSEPPLDRITPVRIKAYIDNLKGEVASSTTFTYVLDLLRFAKSAAPERDWSWLSAIKNRLWSRTKPAKDKTSKIRSAKDLFNLGIELMSQAHKVRSRYNPFAAPQQFRDGLIIAILAARPIRLKNLAAIEIGRHLRRSDNQYWLTFDASEVKNRKSIEVPLPQELTPWLETYINVHRVVLLGRNVSNRLWISRSGTPLNSSVIRYHIKNRTRVAFGEAISPHLFRDCAATSIAIEDPGHVRISASILGHHRLATTQRYYDQSRMLEAGRIHQSAVARIRRDIHRRSHGS